MINISDRGRGMARRASRSLGLAAAALFALSAVPGQRAEALSLINPGATQAAKHAPEGLTTEVRGHGGGGGGSGGGHIGGGGGHIGGGGGVHIGAPAIHGGSFKSGGPVFHGSAIRSGPVFHGSGIRHSGFAFRHHHRFHRHFFYGASYYPYYDDYPYYYSYRRCPVVWTHYGPRRICHYRHWRHHHWRHHHRRHHHYRVY